MAALSRLSGRDNLVALLLGALAFLVIMVAPVTYASADARGSLLTAQSILQHGTIQLDAYQPAQDYRFVTKNDHLYYYFPLESALLATPAVWLSRLAGQNMVLLGDEARLQKTLAALSVALAAGLIYRFCRHRLPFVSAALLSSSFVFGSGLSSTLGTAFWSSNAALLLLLLTLSLVGEQVQLKPQSAFVIGVGLCVAYITRPTSFLLTILLIGYLAWREWRQALLLAGGFALCLLLFCSFSLREYGQLLPDYYLPARVSGETTFLTALYGHLLSPARGLLVYSPQLVFVAVLGVWAARSTPMPPLFWLALAWFVLHLLVVARFPHWWGGAGYGPRLLAEVLPALVVIAVFVWRWLCSTQSLFAQQAASMLYSLLTALAIFINTGQGLFNTATSDWNANPNIDQRPEYLFDWRYPQFLASKHQLAQRAIELQLLSLKPYLLGSVIGAGSNLAIFDNWYAPEENNEGLFRWSVGPVARVIFNAEDGTIAQNAQLKLEVGAGTYLPQTVAIYLNGALVGSFQSQQCRPARTTFFIAASSLRFASEANVLEFRAAASARPSERVVGATDTRDLGVCLWSVALNEQ